MVDIISTEELKELIDSNAEFVLIDVREPAELNYGMIPTAVNIPLGNIREGLGKFDKDSNIIFHCRTGARSQEAAEIAFQLGFVNAKNFKDSIWGWFKLNDNGGVEFYGPEPF